MKKKFPINICSICHKRLYKFEGRYVHKSFIVYLKKLQSSTEGGCL